MTNLDDLNPEHPDVESDDADDLFLRAPEEEADIRQPQPQTVDAHVAGSPLETLMASPEPHDSNLPPLVVEGATAAKARKPRSVLTELVMVGLMALLLALVMRVFVTQVYAISGDSMQPTLNNKEMVMIHKLSPALVGVDRGDLVIFQSPKDAKKDLIKRVIAVGGDTIRIESNQVFVNDRLLQEDYIRRSISLSDLDATFVDEGTIFVLGDNRPQSQDSRHFGAVAIEKIKGKVFFRVWPLRAMSMLP